MLTDAQIDSIIKCIGDGGGTEFQFSDAPLCDALNAIISHLESQRMESSLFGIINVQEDPEPGEFKQMTPEEAQRAFVHHAMHWAFQLGVGATLHAVGQDKLRETRE